MKRGKNVELVSPSSVTNGWIQDTRTRSISRAFYYAIAFILVAIHFGIVWYNCFRNFPNYDEIGHLPAGIYHWEFGAFDYYKVNPPLVRMIAAFPAWIRGDAYLHNWSTYKTPPHFRMEFIVGVDLLKKRGLTYQESFIVPRIFASVFSLIAIVLILKEFSKLVGRFGALLCAILWMFSPEILAHASSIGPDVASATVGIAMSITALKYVKRPTFFNAICVGMLLGVSLVTKFTWLTGLFSIPFTIILCERFCFQRPIGERFQCWTRDFSLMIATAITFTNVVYCFEGTLQPLGSFPFQSAFLNGNLCSSISTGNRFEESILGMVPVPMPSNYILGLDFLKWEFEQKYWSFLNGEWKRGAWRCFYFYSVLYKTPLSLLIASSLGFIVFLVGWARGFLESELVAFVLLLGVPAVACFAAVIGNSGFSHHHRYVIMIYPPMFLLASLFGSPNIRGILAHGFLWKNESNAIKNLNRNGLTSHWPEFICIIFVLFSVTSCLRVHPHYLSYFNAVAGGSENGWKHLGSSCVDFGQDILLVNEWIESHPRAIAR